MTTEPRTNLNATSGRNSLLGRNARTEEDCAEEEPYQCALGGVRLPCLQGFAQPKFFLLLFCALGILQGAYRTYFIGILSTIERRFAVSSKTMGLVLAAENISPVLAVITGYYGSSTDYNKPLWLFVGMSAVALSCGLCTLPHFIFGYGSHMLTHPGPHTVPDALGHEFCSSVNRSLFQDCLTDISVSADATIFIMFLGNLLNGFGSAAFYVIGISYIDENVKKKDSPMYFGTMFALRLFGPSAGFFLASYCLSHFENPYVDPVIQKSDPRWVGAWWMGYMLLGLMVALLSIPLLLFPRRLLRSPTEEESSASKLTPILTSYNPENTDGGAVKEAVKRLLKNPQFLCQAAALSFIVNGLMGFLFAIPKYMETQFRKSASTASLFSGSTSLVTMLVGVLFGGAVIRKVKPKPNWISAYIVFVDVFLFVCFFGAMFLGCAQLDVANATSSSGGLNLLNKCNGDCGCTTVVFQPVCDLEDGITYFSPCFAGCKGVNASNSNQMLGCRCVQGATEETPGTPETGICFSECSLFVPFVAVLGLAKTIFATSRIGTALIGIRSVHQKDKTVALTLLLMLGSIFGFVPYPLVYGAIMDSSCLIWNTNCGAHGNCWLYDADKFRYTLHGTSMGFVAVGATFNLLAYTFRDRYTGATTQDEDDDEDVVFMRNMGHPGMTHSS